MIELLHSDEQTEDVVTEVNEVTTEEAANTNESTENVETIDESEVEKAIEENISFDANTMREYFSSFQQVMDSIQQQLSNLREMAKLKLIAHSLKFEILDGMLRYKLEDIKAWTKEDALAFLEKYTDKTLKATLAEKIEEYDQQIKKLEKDKLKGRIKSLDMYQRRMRVLHSEIDKLTKYIEKGPDTLEVTDLEEKPVEEIIDLIIHIKNWSLEILKCEYDFKKFKESTGDMIKPYYDEIAKHNSMSEREAKLAELKEACNNPELDEEHKAKYAELINELESMIYYSFMYERLDTYGDDEINRIVDGFLNYKNGGEYMMKKYASNAKKLPNYSPEIFKALFNLEESFLPEEYHVFNNLFLYVYMRFVAYADVYSKKDVAFVDRITLALTNLVYHNFKDENDATIVIDLIKKVDDYFRDYEKIFEENNVTYKNSPIRKAQEEENEANYRESLYEELDKLGVEYDKNSTTEDLLSLVKETTKNLIESQIDTETNLTLDMPDHSDEEAETTETDNDVEVESTETEVVAE